MTFAQIAEAQNLARGGVRKKTNLTEVRVEVIP